MKDKKFYIVFLSVFLMSFSVFSQSRKQLEFQRKKYKLEILKLNRLLFKEQKKEKNALENLLDINQKIEVRDKLISTINLEAIILSKEIQTNEKKLVKLDKKLKALKADYGDMIYRSYKSKSQHSRAMFLLSSQNFYQAYKRIAYMKQYTSFRKKQSKEIVNQTKYIDKIKDSLLFQKKIKDTLILSEKNQKKEIETDKKKQESIITIIKRKGNKYKRDLRKKIKEEKRVAAKIDKIIKAEIAKANILVKSKSTNKNEFILSLEAKALAVKFELNKGKLPWPVKEGLVVRKFGKQPHPTFSGITINGTGLHIVTSKGSNAEAIFNGEVLNVLVASGGKKNVLIRHGNYITSYNNLEQVIVKKGDKIVTGQKIGKIFTDKLTAKTTLIFVLFKNTTRLNPASWLLKR